MSQSHHGDDDVLVRPRPSFVDHWNDVPVVQPEQSTQVTPSKSPGFPSLGLPSQRSSMPALPAQAVFQAEPGFADRGPSTAPVLVTPLQPSTPRRSAPTMTASIENSEQALPLWVPVLSALAFYLALSGTHDVVGVFLPGSASNPMWRFGVTGAAAPMLVKIILGTTLATVALLVSNRRKLSLAFAWLQVGLAVLLTMVVPLFALDAIQVTPSLPSNLTGRVLMVSIGFAVAFLLGSSVMLLTCAWALRRATRTAAIDPGALVKAWDR